ncbi:hypothetical protein HJC23_012183 [Cyclotella cryptica]|uniref:DAGKc domain-containing protein n=1 Tax=Cyclotella cryptica TaxID=29204 RepID=A0ABD3PU51_9STRA|eukprot:CCRYP_011208-RA/>CCRYP_011208-RA protein AED:0.19 eAED:0.19 QI:182/1/1/1/0.5/0.4/5/1462/568
MDDVNQAPPEPQWPVAAASRIRFKCIHGEKVNEPTFCRLFYNASKETIDLVPADDVNVDARAVYDDNDTGIEDDLTYQSYLASMKDADRRVIDSFHLTDVIGADLSLECNSQNPNTFHGMERYSSSASINIYSYPKMKKGKACSDGGKRSPCHKRYAIDSRGCEDFGDVRRIVAAIRRLSSSQHNITINNKPIRYLVILNPFSGGGGVNSKTGAKYVYEKMLNPMLEQIGIEHDALMTLREGHARDRMKIRLSRSAKESEGSTDERSHHNENNCTINTDTESKDISEYNAIIAMGGDGILFEIMQGIHARADEKELFAKLKFGIIGCGTSNGLAKSILHWSGENYGPLESIFQICKGSTAPLDIASYQLANTSKTYTSFLTFSWGLIADCDLESECIRWLGSLRQDIWAVYRGILCRKKYRARLSYLPPNSAGGVTGEVNSTEFGKPLSNKWVTIEDDFIVFWACNVSHAAHNMYNCPMAKMNDGMFHILVVRGSCSRIRLLEMLLKLESGNHIHCRDLEVIDCVAYRLTPLSENSYNDLDGELIESGPIQAHIIPFGAQFFAGKMKE